MMRELDSAKLDSAAQTAESRGVAAPPAADRASAGPDLFVVHDVPGRPLEIAVYRERARIAQRPMTGHQALVMAEQLVAAVRRRQQRPRRQR